MPIALILRRPTGAADTAAPAPECPHAAATAAAPRVARNVRRVWAISEAES